MRNRINAREFEFFKLKLKYIASSLRGLLIFPGGLLFGGLLSADFCPDLLYNTECNIQQPPGLSEWLSGWAGAIDKIFCAFLNASVP